MKKVILGFAVGFALAGSVGFAAQVRDWKDLDAVHKKVLNAIQDMERARAANHYDMAGHGAKAEDALRNAERELHEAIEAAKAAK